MICNAGSLSAQTKIQSLRVRGFEWLTQQADRMYQIKKPPLAPVTVQK